MSAADVPGLGSTVITANFQYRDMEHWLRTEYGNTKYRGSFVVRPAKKFGSKRLSDGTVHENQRCFSLQLAIQLAATNS